MNDQSQTPITDANEHFIVSEANMHSVNYRPTVKPGPVKRGFVYSEVARSLELEVNRLRALLANKEQPK